MAQRVSEEIDGIDVFTYDTDLLAVVMKDYRKPELLELAKLRNYPGVWKLNKLELAIIVADRLTAERDEQRKLDEVNEQMTETLDEIAPIPARTLREGVPFPRPTADALDELRRQAAMLDEKRTIARAYLSTPDGVVLSWDAIDAAVQARAADRELWLDEQAATGAARTERDELIERGRAAGLMEGFSHRFPENDALRRAVDFAESSRAEEAQRVDALIEQLDGNPAEPVDKPRDLDIWLQPGVVLIGPQSGTRYRFARWDPKAGGAVLFAIDGRPFETVIHQAEVTTWQYLPKASAAGVAEAKRRVPWRRTFVEHMASRQVYEVLGMDNILTGKLFLSHACGTECSGHERAVSPEVLRVDYRAVCEHGGAQGQCLKCSPATPSRPLYVRSLASGHLFTFQGADALRVWLKNSDGVISARTHEFFAACFQAVCEHGGAQDQCLKCGSAPTYAVGNRVRWTEDPRPMFVRQVGFTGVSVSPTPDGTYTALARFEDLSPWVEGRPSSGLDKIVADLDAAEAKVAELLIENGTLKEQNGRWAVEASDAIAELGRLRQRLLWMIGHWQTQGRGTTVPVEDIAMALRDSR